MKAVGIAVIFTILYLVSAHADTSLPSEQNWGIYRNGDRIGSRTTRFSREGDELIAETESQVTIKIAFITIFEHTERQREVWRNGKLIDFVSRIDDDGDKYLIKTKPTEDGLVIGGYGRPHVVPDGIVPATLWNFETVKAGTLLDVMRGRLLKVSTVSSGPDTVDVNGTKVPATRYAITGDEAIDLWYSDDRRLLRALFITDKGSRIEFLAAQSK